MHVERWTLFRAWRCYSTMTAPFPEIGYERIRDAESSTNDALGPSIKPTALAHFRGEGPQRTKRWIPLTTLNLKCERSVLSLTSVNATNW
jgi:hypothetical protein